MTRQKLTSAASIRHVAAIWSNIGGIPIVLDLLIAQKGNISPVDGWRDPHP
jgi:hypothetical protein